MALYTGWPLNFTIQRDNMVATRQLRLLNQSLELGGEVVLDHNNRHLGTRECVGDLRCLIGHIQG